MASPFFPTMDIPGINRRHFLRLGALAAASFYFSPIQALQGQKKKVVILGAGLSGLVAAHELKKAGHDVTILEAQRHPGGRVHTIRDFSDGMYAEAGAGRIPDFHSLTLLWVKEFGLELEPFYPSSGMEITYWKGKRIRSSADSPADMSSVPGGFTDEERRIGFAGLDQRYMEQARTAIGKERDGNWPQANLLKYDDQSFAEYLRSLGASDDAIHYLSFGFEKDSAFDMMQDAVSHAAKLWKIKGGNDLLPKGFAARLSDQIQYGCPVTAMEHNSSSVTVSFMRGAATDKIIADYVICTLPFSVLRHIAVVPAFSPAKEKAVRELRYGPVTRTSLQYRARSWESRGENGFGTSDAPLELWHPTFTQPGTRGILQAYMYEDLALNIGSKSPDDQVNWTAHHIEEMMPGSLGDLEGGVTKNWHTDPWQLGAFAEYQSGEFRSLYSHIARPEGRIHFAGEHASPWWGWMQGALHAGTRAAREVNAA
jgi:monoamine oxidase